MSDQPTLTTARHFDYIAAHTAAEPPYLSKLKAAALEAGIPAIQVNAAQLSLMQILLKLIRAKTVLEVGTLAGYSAIGMAMALPPDGAVHTAEINPGYADFAQTWADDEASGVAGRVKVLRGPGTECLRALADAAYDAAFLDADKSGYSSYLAECRRLVRPGGLIMVDNAFAFGELFAESPQDRETPAVRAFNDEMAQQGWLHGIIVPTGDGMWVAVRD